MSGLQADPRLLERLEALPHQPGVYLFKDNRGIIIYIGKARDLNNRVRQYFDRSRQHDAKTIALLRRALDLDWIITDSEVEALLLENTLIKHHKPRYNILLKDDKTYPYIRVTNEEFPRIFPTRKVVRDGSRYFGPYTDVQYMHFLIKMIRTLFPVRSCDLPLTRQTIDQGKYKVCLDYHIGKCHGPCVGLINRESYQQFIEQAINFLRGKTSLIEQQLNEQMQRYAEQLQFEQAAEVRDRLQKLRSYITRQKVISTELIDRDIVGLAYQDGYACVMLLFIREGKVIGKRHWLIPTDGSQIASVIRIVLEQWYLNSDEIPSEVLLPLDISDQVDILLKWFEQEHGKKVEFLIPKIGDKRKLVTLACTNAEFLIRDHLLQRARREQALPRTIAALQRDLRLPKPPLRIECFDNSHLQGSEYVSSMVVFINGKPHKSEYRRYRLRTVEGNDDFSAMAEVVRRRYVRAIQENIPMPDLIVIDGGKGQLSSAQRMLKEMNLDRIPIIALAKRLEEVFVPGQSDAILLPRTSSSLRLLQQIRDEAHRFALEYHQLLRKKRTLTTTLTEIPGIGPVRAQKLLKAFGSVTALQSATLEQLSLLIGRNAAVQLLKSFRHKSSGDVDHDSGEE